MWTPWNRNRPSPKPKSQTKGDDQTGGNGDDIPERITDCPPHQLWASLYTDGYVCLPNVVEKAYVDRALRAINCSLGRSVPNRQDMCPDVANSPEITDLYNKTAVKGIIDQLLKESTSVSGGQIAIRFPGDNTNGSNFQIPNGWESHWHIDGLGDHNVSRSRSFFGDIRNFTALVGVVLQDVNQEFMGNLVVYPGSHWELQDHFQKNGFDDLYCRGVDGLPRNSFRKPPKHIRAKAGDVVILNYCLAHNVAPNVSPLLRYAVYFRVSGQSFRRKAPKVEGRSPANGAPMDVMHHRPDSMLNVWCDWPGLREAVPPHAVEVADVATTDSMSEEHLLELAIERSKHDK